MTDAVRLTTGAGADLAPGQAVDVGPDGLQLQLRLPAGRRLQRAALALAATGTAPALLVPSPVLDSDGFSVDAQGVVNTANAANAHWLGVSWDVERAIVGLAITAPSASTAAPATAARVRMFSAGHWLPLPPRDMLAFADGEAGMRFPACAASRLMLELQAENKVGEAWSGVLVPGAVNLSGVQVRVQATPQACHVSLAVADEAPFFRAPGPLPAQPVAVEGLARALNRFIGDNPGATVVPLTLRAAAPSQLRIASFDALLDPVPDSRPPAPPPSPPPRPEQAGTRPAGSPSTLRGRWCRAGHLAAQGFAAVPAGRGLSAVELWVRPLGAGAVLRGSLGLHADQAGRPAAEPLRAPLAWTCATGGTAPPQWLRCELPLPAAVPPDPWWAVLRVDEGELLWYQDGAPPPGAQAGLAQAGGGPWMPVQPDAAAWLQARLQLVDLAGPA